MMTLPIFVLVTFHERTSVFQQSKSTMNLFTLREILISTVLISYLKKKKLGLPKKRYCYLLEDNSLQESKPRSFSSG